MKTWEEECKSLNLPLIWDFSFYCRLSWEPSNNWYIFSKPYSNILLTSFLGFIIRSHGKFWELVWRKWLLPLWEMVVYKAWANNRCFTTSQTLLTGFWGCERLVLVNGPLFIFPWWKPLCLFIYLFLIQVLKYNWQPILLYISFKCTA